MESRYLVIVVSPILQQVLDVNSSYWLFVEVEILKISCETLNQAPGAGPLCLCLWPLQPWPYSRRGHWLVLQAAHFFMCAFLRSTQTSALYIDTPTEVAV